MPAPYRDILLVYERDISPLYDMQDSLTRFALMSSLITAVCFCLCLYLAIWGLTKPLHALSAMTGKLAAGAYSERLDSKRKDEFGELAANFDQMAEAVQRHIGELEEYATEKQRFAENLAHEIRTPLTAIKGFAEFFVSAFASDEERAKAAAYIKSETARLSQLSDTLLVIADVGKDGFSPQPVQLKDLFAAVVEIKEPLLKKRQQKLLASVVPSDMSVSGNFDLLTVFLSNCIDNASHASQEGAEIELNAYLDGGRAVVEVADRGIGMTNEQAPRAFEAFYRADSSRSRAHGGVGLGLALCKQIAKAHGAEIKLDSAPVKGTSIKIFLQLAVQNSV
jgi:signal transduction histidine kinase